MPTATGAYGLRISGLGSTGQLLVPAPTEAPPLRVHVDTDGAGEASDDELDDDHARIALPGGGWADVDRATASAALHLPHAATPAELVHPFIGSACAVAAHWRGALTFHAGGVLIDGRAWGVLGDKGRGKSTALATLAGAGVGIVTDDLLVVEGDQAFAGPRCLDLRRGAAELFPHAEALGVVGVRSRWRLPLSPVPWSAPLGGWLVLEWGDEFSAEPVDHAAKLGELGAALAIAAAPDPRTVMGLVARPMLRITRPRALARLDELVELVAEATRR